MGWSFRRPQRAARSERPFGVLIGLSQSRPDDVVAFIDSPQGDVAKVNRPDTIVDLLAREPSARD
jgi:hypothetical protein